MLFGWRQNRQLYIAAVLVLGALFAVSGCDKLKKGEPAKFEPGQEWLQHMRDGIKEHVSDADRASQLLALVDQFENDLEALDQTVQQYYRKIYTVDADYNATATDFRTVFDAFKRERLVFRKRFLDQRFKMAALTTPEEWEQLADIKKGDAVFLNWQRMPGER